MAYGPENSVGAGSITIPRSLENILRVSPDQPAVTFPDPSGLPLLTSRKKDLNVVLDPFGAHASTPAGIETTKDSVSWSWSRAGWTVKTIIRTFEDQWIHVSVELEASNKNAVPLEARSEMNFLVPNSFPNIGAGDFWLTPHLAPKKDFVIADQIFRSPAVIAVHGHTALALVPDLNHIRAHPRARTALDAVLNQTPPLLAYGLTGFKPVEHVFFARDHRRIEREPRPKTGDDKLSWAYYLKISTVSNPLEIIDDVRSFLWETFAAEFRDKVLPQTVSFRRYALYGEQFLENHPEVYKELELEGERVGGIFTWNFIGKHRNSVANESETRRFMVDEEGLHRQIHSFISRNYLRNPALGEALEFMVRNLPLKVIPMIHNMLWFNNVRTAFGLWYFGKKLQIDKAADRARKALEFWLRSKRQSGVRATACYCPEDKILWKLGTRALANINLYSLSDNALTWIWALQWHRDLAPDRRIIQGAEEFAQTILRFRNPDGSFPNWLDVDARGEFVPRPELNHGATSSAVIHFLAELYVETHKNEYLEAAVKGGDFLIEKVIPYNKWFDPETFYSCSPKPEHYFDYRTKLPPQNTIAMIMTADALMALHRVAGQPSTGDRFLIGARQTISVLCLYQQVWNPPFLNAYVFGGFGVMNSDAEWNDARQALCARTLADFYSLTGEKEFFERAVAALRAGFAMTLIPENRRIAPINTAVMLPRHFGATFENYSHLGYECRVLGFHQYHWGTGSALSAAAYIGTHFGDVYVDTINKNIFGINGVSACELKIEGKTISFRITPALAEPEPSLMVRFKIAEEGIYKVVVNGVDRGDFSRPELDRGIVLKN